MADELTINYEFVQPELAIPGWGPKLNSTIAQIDTVVYAVESSLTAFIQQKSQPNGLASLGATGLLEQDVPAAQVPVEDSGNYFTGVDSEAVFQEIGLKLKGIQASTVAGGATGRWSKLATLSLAGSDDSSSIVLSLATTGKAFSNVNAKVHVRVANFTNLSIGSGSTEILIQENQLLGTLANNGIKIVSDSNAQGASLELWIKNSSANNFSFVVSEIARAGDMTVTYETASPWQVSEPTGAAVNVYSEHAAFKGNADTASFADDIPDELISPPKMLAPTAGSAYPLLRVLEVEQSTTNSAYPDVGHSKSYSDSQHLGFTALIAGNVRCSFTHRVGAFLGGRTSRVRIVKNGVVVQEVSTDQDTYQPTTTIDVPVAVGDKVIFQHRSSDGTAVYWKDLLVSSGTLTPAVA